MVAWARIALLLFVCGGAWAREGAPSLAAADGAGRRLEALDEEGSGLKAADLQDVHDFKEWLESVGQEGRDSIFRHSTPGEIPKGIYTGFMMSEPPDYDEFNISLANQAVMTFIMSRWIGKVFDGKEVLTNVLSDEQGFSKQDLEGEINLETSFVDSNKSWIARYSNNTAYGFILDEFREVQPGFLFGKTFLVPVSAGDKVFIECGLVKIDENVPEEGKAVGILLEATAASEESKDSDAETSADSDTEPSGSVDGEPYEDKKADEPHSRTSDAAQKMETKMPELEAEGDGLVPEFTGLEDFKMWLEQIGEDKRNEVFKAASPGSILRGVFNGFMLSDPPDFNEFGLSISNQAVMDFIMKQWIGKVFDGKGRLWNVLRSEQGFERSDLRGDIKLEPGFVDANNSWIAQYPEGSPYNFILDEFREIQTGFLYGKTFLVPAKKGDKVFFECGLVRVGVSVPKGSSSREILLENAVSSEPDDTEVSKDTELNHDVKAEDGQPSVYSSEATITGCSDSQRAYLNGEWSFQHPDCGETLEDKEPVVIALGSENSGNMYGSSNAYAGHSEPESKTLSEGSAESKPSTTELPSLEKEANRLPTDVEAEAEPVEHSITKCKDAMYEDGDWDFHDDPECAKMLKKDKSKAGEDTGTDGTESTSEADKAAEKWMVDMESDAEPENGRKNQSMDHVPDLDSEGTGLAVPELMDMEHFKEWLESMGSEERNKVFMTANAGPMPKGIYSGFMTSEMPDFNEFNVSLSNQAVMNFIMNRWIGKVFDGKGSVRNVLTDESFFEENDLEGTIKLKRGFVDSKKSWVSEYSNDTAYGFILDEFREVYPGFIFGKTFLVPAHSGDRVFFECGLVRIDSKVPKDVKITSALLQEASESEPEEVSDSENSEADYSSEKGSPVCEGTLKLKNSNEWVFLQKSACTPLEELSNDDSVAVTLEVKDTNLNSSIKMENYTKGTEVSESESAKNLEKDLEYSTAVNNEASVDSQIKKAELCKQGSGLDIPDLNSLVDFEEWLKAMNADKRDEIFKKVCSGKPPMGAYKGFMISELPNFDEFGISLSNEANFEFIMNRWMGKVFYEGNEVQNILTNMTASKSVDVTGTIKLESGFLDSRDSWIVHYSNETIYGFILEEFREIKPGLLLGRTFLAPVDAGNKVFVEHGLFRLTETIPKDFAAAQILLHSSSVSVPKVRAQSAQPQESVVSSGSEEIDLASMID